MTDPLSHIRHLVREIGGRAPTSAAERRAGAYVAQSLEGSGFVVDSEPFRAAASPGWAHFWIGVVALAGLAAARWHPILGFLLASVATVGFVGESTGQLLLFSAMVPRRWSQNVVGRRTPPEMPRRRVVLVAHLDSSRSAPLFAPGLVRLFRTAFLAQLFSLCLLSLLLLAGAIPGAHRLSLLLALVPAVVIGLGTLQHLLGEVFGRVVAGANDNASGAAVVLSLAEELAERELPGTELWVVGSGCEESGLFGIRDLVRRHRGDLGNATLINVNSVGAGAIHYLEREGIVTTVGPPPDLLNHAERVAEEQKLAVRATAYHAMSTDATYALSQGVPTLTVMGLRHGLPVNWHWKSDDLDGIDPDAIDTAYAFTRALVLRLAGPGLR